MSLFTLEALPSVKNGKFLEEKAKQWRYDHVDTHRHHTSTHKRTNTKTTVKSKLRTQFTKRNKKKCWINCYLV